MEPLMGLRIVEQAPVVAAVKKEPQLVLELITPDIVDFVFSMIKPMVDELAAQSQGEYTTDYTYAKIKFGAMSLFYGYIVDDKDEYLKADLKVNPLEQRMKRLFDDRIKKEFAGYLLIEYNPNEPKPPHIWQLSILPKFHNTNIFELGQTCLIEEFKKVGAKEITMASSRAGWHDLAIKMGFVETFTIYRKKFA